MTPTPRTSGESAGTEAGHATRSRSGSAAVTRDTFITTERTSRSRRGKWAVSEKTRQGCPGRTGREVPHGGGHCTPGRGRGITPTMSLVAEPMIYPNVRLGDGVELADGVIVGLPPRGAGPGD